MSKRLFKPGMKVHVYTQCHTFLIKCTKGNKMEIDTLKIYKICISQANYQNT